MDYGTIDPQAVHMLAQYRPFEDGSADMHAAHDDLVVAACQSNEGQFSTLESCRQFIEQHLCVELELQEVRDARERLVGNDQAVKVDGGLALTPDARITLNAERVAWEDARDAAFAE